MILIICESILATKTVAIALGANNETSEGIHTLRYIDSCHSAAPFHPPHAPR